MEERDQYGKILRVLDGGLVLRRGKPEDADQLAETNSRIHSDDGPEKPDMGVHAWTRDLLLKPHPTFSPADFIIVEEQSTGKIVSSMNLISQTWLYGGVRIEVGRPELVGTLPEFRKRGLVRAQFEEAHQWSAQRGELLQAITGIPYYYRQFGYEMALALEGGRMANCAQVPALADGASEPYSIRPARAEDVPWLCELYRQACRRYLVCAEWDEALWRYEICGRSAENVCRYDWSVIEDPDGRPLGMLGCYLQVWGGRFAARAFELLPGVSYAAVTPTVMRYLCRVGGEKAEAATPAKPFGLVSFALGEGHPLFLALPGLLPQERRPYAWFLRVADLPAFLLRIADVLSARLAASAFAGHSGELKLSFYRSGLLLAFEQGRLVRVEPWIPQPFGHSGDAGFPDLTFLQLLFGYRTMEELKYAFVDCFCEKPTTCGLLQALFPRLPSDVMPIA